MNPNRLAILIYGDINSGRDALTEEKYKDLASSFPPSAIQFIVDEVISRIKKQ